MMDDNIEYRQLGTYWNGTDRVPNMVVKISEEEIELFKKARYDGQKNIRKCAISSIRRMKKYYKINYKSYLELTEKCAICGFTELVCLHHIVPKFEGGKDIVENYIGLCHNCHTLVHFKKWSLDKIRQWYKDSKKI